MITVLALLLAILIIILLMHIVKKEFFFSKPKSKKYLLVLYGESFRGYKNELNTNLLWKTLSEEEAIQNQIKITDSHIKFIELIKKKFNIDTDIIISTYDNKNLHLIKKKYNPYLIHTKINNKTEQKDIAGFFCNIYDKIEKIKKEYDSIIYLRIDLFLKKKFFEIFKKEYTKITISNWFYGCGLNHPKYFISSLICIIPKKYFENLKKITIYYSDNRWLKGDKEWLEHINKKKYNGHEMVITLLKNTNLKITDFDVLVNTLHSSNTLKDWNPLFIQYDRDISNKWRWPNCYIKNYEICDSKNTNDCNNFIKYDIINY